MPTTILDADFNRLTQFIQKEYGINLTKKRQLITSRLSSSLEARGYKEFGPFVDHLLKTRDREEMELLLNKLTTNYTYFMREKEHFSFFQNTILPEMVQRHQRDKVLSIWSAGCSSGEEPYTISMYIKDFLGLQADQWDTRVLATDISQRALKAAQEGIYELPATIPEKWRHSYFVPDKKSGHYKVAPKIMSNVIFKTFNLMDPIRFRLKFDVIFCRNVMIYFEQPTKEALVHRFYDATAPGGYLLIGHSESLGKNTPYRILSPATYQKR